jgi:hypothetical protein
LVARTIGVGDGVGVLVTVTLNAVGTGVKTGMVRDPERETVVANAVLVVRMVETLTEIVGEPCAETATKGTLSARKRRRRRWKGRRRDIVVVARQKSAYTQVK